MNHAHNRRVGIADQKLVTHAQKEFWAMPTYNLVFRKNPDGITSSKDWIFSAKNTNKRRNYDREIYELLPTLQTLRVPPSTESPRQS
ncbi:MAG: hypothetical protein AB4426_02085 [Xenococcaceae cyanobacterium]